MKSYDDNSKDDEIILRSSGPAMDEPQDDEQEIDLLELAMKLWRQKKKIALGCFIGAVVGLVVAFSIPREYSTSVKLAPELGNGQKMSGSLGAMAAMVGIGGASQGGADAVNPTLYPDVVSSVPFLVGLFDVPVEDIDGEHKVSVKEYVEEDLRAPWWSAVMGAPFKLLGMLRGSDEEEVDPNKPTDTFQLTRQENDVVMALQKRISASVDTKTSVITISVMIPLSQPHWPTPS